MTFIDIQPIDGWYDCVVEDFVTNVLPSFGITASYKDVSFTGFCSQGDGVSFTGNFFLTDVSPAELKAACPTEVELHELAAELQVLAEAHHEIQGTISRLSSLYSHSNTMCIGDYSSNNGYCNEETEAFAVVEDSVLRIYRQLADWLYRRLEDEYNFHLADETTRQWSEAIEERKSLQVELEQLLVDVAANPPKTVVQAKACTTVRCNLTSAIAELGANISQLADQFHYWSDGKSIHIEDFYENYL